MSEWTFLARHQVEAANNIPTIPSTRPSPHPTMNDAAKRSILRWIHLIFSIPIIGYIYSPFKELPNYAPVVRYVAFPMIALSGLWMWKGHLVRRLLAKRPA